MNRIFILVVIFIFCSFPQIKGQNQDEILSVIGTKIIHGDYKECRDVCSRFLSQGMGEKDVSTRNVVRAYLAFTNIALGYKDEGLKLLQQSESEMEGYLGTSSIEYAQWLSILANIYKTIDNNKAISLLQKEIDIYDDLEQYKTQGYVNALLQICQVYNSFKTSASSTVDKILARLKPLSKEVCGVESIEYAVTLLTAIKNAENKGDANAPIILSDEFWEVANPSFKENPYIQSFLYGSRLRAFIASGQYEKALEEASKYSASVKKECMLRYKSMTNDERISAMGYVQDWFFENLLRLAIFNPTKESASLSYNGLLFSKGLMQNLEFIEEREENTNILSIKWEQVRKALNPGEAAIEFVAYSHPNSIFPTYYYGALVLKREYDNPHIVKLNSITFSYDDDKDLKRQCMEIWQPLLQELKDVKTIYFSPFAHIHNMPIENFLPAELEGVNVLRLSSTRQLAIKNSDKGNGAAVFGGLKYDLSVAEMVKDSRDRVAEEGLPFLKGTLDEANKIVEIMRLSRKQKWDVALLTGSLGTEHAFKLLSGKRNRVVHLATHGFYYNSSQQEEIDFLKMGSASYSVEDKPLTRSGLYMAGAENIYDGYAIPQGIDDGILTAQEISCLDLRGLDLVVLSACETAGGDVLGDGVFGLQRGFKKAGAQSILMSLWKVDDEATSLLMTEFYRNWIGENRTKHDALEAAKQTVRSHKERGWDGPKYWAAFILLDGLD